MAQTLYPLRFHPVYRQYLWGGRRLESALGKSLGPGPHFAESWEVVDHGADQSHVAEGALAGRTLGEIRQTWPQELLGYVPAAVRFPLLFKYLDCHRPLSVQVHPNDQQAARLDPPDLGKTEAWHILSAEPGSKLYVGLKRGFDRPALAREVARGTTELCLQVIEPRAGDTLLIPAGVVHALGAGMLVAEIQQSSDTTYRLFDWNRLDDDGRPRPLHVERALETIDYGAPPVTVRGPEPTDRPYAWRLAECDKFVLERWQLAEPLTLSADGRFRIISVVSGAVSVPGDPAHRPLVRGQTTLIPACWDPLRLLPAPNVELLVAHLP